MAGRFDTSYGDSSDDGESDDTDLSEDGLDINPCAAPEGWSPVK